MRVSYCTQGSDEWFNIRKGVATASNFAQILTAGGKLSKSHVAYARKLARECVIDDPTSYDNKHMEWGRDHESEARNLYQIIKDRKVQEVGFVHSEFSDLVGCSPDGLSGDTGLEIKCPAVDTHVNYIMDGVLPDTYKLQVHGSMVVTGLKRWDFMSYFPHLNPFIITVEWDEFTDKLAEELRSFAEYYESCKDEIIDTITIKEELF